MSLSLIIGTVVIALVAAGMSFGFAPQVSHAPTPPLSEIPSDFPADFSFEIVSTEKVRAQGLSGRTEVPPNYGMLFIFETPGMHGFWMKDMLVSIDILWLGDDGTILGVEESVSPATYPKAFYPPTNVRYVLEVRAGETKAHGWGVGTKLPLP